MKGNYLHILWVFGSYCVIFGGEIRPTAVMQISLSGEFLPSETLTCASFVRFLPL